MKVILLRDVAKIGRKDEVKEVPSGYAINYLIPRKLAIAATTEELRKHADRAEKHTSYDSKEVDRFEKSVAALRATPLTLEARANEQGHLFSSVRSEDIILAAKRAGVTLTEREIRLDEPLRTVGEHTITLVHGQMSETCTIHISAQA